MSMRFVHALGSLALPGLVLWGVYAATDPEPIIGSVLGFLPAIAAILATTWKIEKRSRALFLERRKVQRNLDENARMLNNLLLLHPLPPVSPRSQHLLPITRNETAEP